MPRFPVLHLSENLLTLVLENFELDDLFNISLCSKKLRNIVKEFTSSLETRIPLYIQFESFSHLVAFDRHWYYREPGFPPLFKFYNRRDKKSPDVNFDDPMVFRIDNTIFKFGKSKYNDVVCVCEHPEVETTILAEYLLDTFSAELIRLEIDKRSIWNLDAIIENKNFKKTKQLRVGQGIVTDRVMRTVLEDFEAGEVLDIWCSSGYNFTCEKAFSVAYLGIHNAYFFNRQNLLTMNCSRVTIGNNSLVNSDINEFLKQWIKKENDKLEYLLITNFQNLDVNEMLEGIETIPGSRKKSEATSLYENYEAGIFPFEEGMDIRRPSDGKLATILNLHEEWLIFVVWLDPNPFF